MKLSILICTLHERSKSLDDLLVDLRQQSVSKQVEIIWLGDNRSMTTGAKRNALLSIAKGEYVVFIDDDDKVSKDYVNAIYSAIDMNCDVICFNVKYTCEAYTRPVYYSMYYEKDKNLPASFERIPNHLMAVKRKLAVKAGYPNVTIGEDSEYAGRLKPLLSNEVQLNKTLYEYLDYE